MANQAKTFWSSDRVNGPAGRFRVVVTRLPATKGSSRDQYSASLLRNNGDADETVEPDFWQHSTPPHDADKLAFRERARRAAAEHPAG
jgi:hypothetical protein